MFKKFGMGMMAVVMAVVFSAFTMPKKAVSVTAQDKFWYEVVNNQIPQNATPVLQGSESEAAALEICDPGSQRDCLRGFNEQLNTSAGPVTPSSMPSDAEIKTDEQP